VLTKKRTYKKGKKSGKGRGGRTSKGTVGETCNSKKLSAPKLVGQEQEKRKETGKKDVLASLPH